MGKGKVEVQHTLRMTAANSSASFHERYFGNRAIFVPDQH